MTYDDLVQFKSLIVNWVAELNLTFVVVINFHIYASCTWSDMLFCLVFSCYGDQVFGFLDKCFSKGHLFVIWNAFYGFNKM